MALTYYRFCPIGFRITSQVASAAMSFRHTVQWDPVLISNRYDVALRMPPTRYFFMDDDGLAITDQRTQPLQPVTIGEEDAHSSAAQPVTRAT
jgi:hypothetical protein